MYKHPDLEQYEAKKTFGKKHRRLKKKHVYYMLLITISFLLYLSINYTIIIHYDTYDYLICHYNVTEDLFPVVDDYFDPPEKSIFFHETSCSGRLNERQACAVESAAKTHPDWQINVFFSATSVTSYNVLMKLLRNYPNIKYYRVYITDYAKGTPLEPLIKSGVLRNSKYPVAHTADALRYITLWKWSGLYLDLDIIMVKSTENLAKNYAGKEINAVASGVLAFSSNVVGRIVANACVRDMSLHYDPEAWGQSPAVITRVLKNLCNGTDIMKMNAKTCSGFEVYPSRYFYPINWRNAHKYFKYLPDNITIGDTYGFHVYNKITMRDFIEKNSMYEQLTRSYCPIVFNFTSEKEKDEYFY